MVQTGPLDDNPSVKICSTCLSQVASGDTHTCNKMTAVSSLIILAFSLVSSYPTLTQSLNGEVS